ncbi:uncharacterized protein LOC128735304 [Sabethes cyaneus]|uniref:uncharacterized protein LOC128735304 n=1 Tax=Sabethes cyaneus TaxID=53552 RepID=UPI00237EB009|nr:uncharacterized protein LOC128735304 [Sabethes cyaneus]
MLKFLALAVMQGLWYHADTAKNFDATPATLASQLNQTTLTDAFQDQGETTTHSLCLHDELSDRDNTGRSLVCNQPAARMNLELKLRKDLMDYICSVTGSGNKEPPSRSKERNRTKTSEQRSSKSKVKSKKTVRFNLPDSKSSRNEAVPKPVPIPVPKPIVDFNNPETLNIKRKDSIIAKMPNIKWNFDKGEPEPETEKPAWLEPFNCNGRFKARFDLLPMELILVIFKQITVSDRLAAGGTCRRWMEASHFYEPFLNQTYYHFDRIEFGDQVGPFKYFSQGFRCYPRLIFTQVEFNKHSDFWDIHGLWITELTLRSCKIKKKKFISIMRNLLNLRRLELMCCDELFKSWSLEYNTEEPMFPFFLFCLRHLSLAGCDYFNEYHLERFTTMAPNLRSIDVSNCFINLYLSKRITMLDRVMKLINRNRYLMKAVNLADTPCVDDFIWHCLCEIEGLQLTHLTVAYSDRVPLKDPGIIRFLSLQTELTHLDLTASIGLNDDCLQTIITSCPLLHTLKIRRCWLISDEGVADMHTMQHLQVLDISSCERISDYGISTGVVGKRPRVVTELYLSLLNNLTDSTLYYMLVSFKNLQILELDSTTNCVTDESIQYIACYLHDLKHLNVTACTKLLVHIFKFLSISDRNAASYTCSKWYEASKYLGFARQVCLHLIGVEFDDSKPPIADLLLSPHVFPVLKLTRVRIQQAVYSQFWADFGPSIGEITFEKCMIWRERIISVFKHMKNLRTARFVECDLLRDDLFRDWKFFENGLLEIRFGSVTALSLAKNNFTELQFRSIVEMMPNLTELDLSNCFSYVDAASKTQMLNCISNFILERQFQLKSLNLSAISVDDLFLRKMNKALQLRLEGLCLTYLEKMPLRDAAIISLLRQQIELRTLDLSQSVGITDYCLDQIVKYMPKLRELNLSGCWGVGDYGVSQIFRLQQLEKLDLSKCRITKKGILDGASLSNKKNVKEFHLEQITTLDDDCIVKIGANFTNLTVLNLGGTSSCMTDWSAQYIFCNLTSLVDVNFERSTKVT